MTAPEFSRALVRNAWDWDLYEFARRLKLDPHTPYTQNSFQQFRELTQLLGALDDATITILASAPAVPAVPAPGPDAAA